VDLSRKELYELQKAIEVRKREIGVLLYNEPKKQKAGDKWKDILRTLDGLQSKLDYEKGKLTDYSKYHILLVDDVEMVREFTSFLLKENGFCHIDEANDGDSAIAKIKNKSVPYGKETPYDLVLCDMNMPLISGLDVLRLTREDSRLSSIPFIMVSGIKDRGNLLEAINLGVSDYVTKPFDEKDLLAKIDSALL